MRWLVIFALVLGGNVAQTVPSLVSLNSDNLEFLYIRSAFRAPTTGQVRPGQRFGFCSENNFNKKTTKAIREAYNACIVEVRAWSPSARSHQLCLLFITPHMTWLNDDPIKERFENHYCLGRMLANGYFSWTTSTLNENKLKPNFYKTPYCLVYQL